MSLSEKKTRTATKPRRPWRDAAREAINRQFGKHMLLKQVPRKDECENARKLEAALADRDWKAIKFYVHNEIIKLKKSQQGY